MQTIIGLLMQEQTSALANLVALGVGTVGAAIAAAGLMAAQLIHRKLIKGSLSYADD